MSTDHLNHDVTVDGTEIARRTIRKTDWVPHNAAFIDCRTPGSDRKENYAFIGGGVSQNAGQVINLTEEHGFNTGAAGMPNGISNNLHLHFTAEVFVNLGGEFRLRWGIDGTQGDHVLLAPPFIVDAPVLDTIVERLGEAIDAATAS